MVKLNNACGNGKAWVLWTIIFSVIATGAVGLALSSLDRVNDARETMSALREKVAAIDKQADGMAGTGERLAALEAMAEAQEVRFEKMDATLVRLEIKIDRLIQER
jgi:hypothetical protein